MVRQSRCSAGGCIHPGRALHEIHGSDFVHAGDALRSWRHGPAARDCGHLWSYFIFCVATQTGDRHSHGAGGAAEYTHGIVCAPGTVVNGNGCRMRPGGRICGDAPDVVTVIQREPGRSNHLCRDNHSGDGDCLPGLLFTVAPRRDGGSGGCSAGRVVAAAPTVCWSQ